MVKGLQKFMLYLIFIFHFVVPIINFYFFGRVQAISDDKNELDETYLYHKNITNDTQKIYNDFYSSFGYFNIFSLLTLIILIFNLCWNVIMITFVCASVEKGVEWTINCCQCCVSQKDLPSFIQWMIKLATFNPLMGQCVIAILALISKCGEIVYSKEARSRVKNEINFGTIYKDMISNEKYIGIMIALLVIIICCSLAYKLLDKYYFNKKAMPTIHIPMSMNVPIT